MACFLSVSIAQYSVRYLSGEPRQEYFFRYLGLITISVSVFLLSNNFLIIFLAWALISFLLFKLLTFYPNRIGAKESAIKKNIVSRFGDLFLLSGILIIAGTFETLEIDQIVNQVDSLVRTGEKKVPLSISVILFSIGALIKSVQVPFHFWLPDTMETPTPVSALMHAGIVNGGGIFILKSSQIIGYSQIALALMVVFGTVSAVFGALVMITQNSIKKKLAYSTISQMGMMMLACGLQLHAVALFHIFAHSLYKSMAFLSTGSIIDESKKIQCKPMYVSSHVVLSIVFACSLILVIGVIFLNWTQFAYTLYFLVLLMGLCTSFFVKGFEGKAIYAFCKGIGILIIAIVLYFFVESFLHFELEDLYRVNVESYSSMIQLFIGLFVFITFGIGFYLSNEMISPNKEWSKALYVFFWNGGFLPVKTDYIMRKVFSSKNINQV